MGQPAGSNVPASRSEYIGAARRTQGSETSQYLKERKSNETPPVAASEGGIAQTVWIIPCGVVGPHQNYAEGRGRKLESFAKAGESPVPEPIGMMTWHLSTAGHVEPRGNLGGPSSKAKYGPTTDSEPVP